MESLFNGFIPSEESVDPSGEILNKERDLILRKAIDNLPEKEREAIVLKALAGLTFQQAGNVMGIPAKTIASRYRRGLERLENHL